MALFKWTKKRSRAAILLAEGWLINDVADEVGVNRRAIFRWKGDVEFVNEVDRLSCMVDIASRAERLRIAKRMVRDKLKSRQPTDKDLLDWLKYAQSETDGVKLDLANLLTALSNTGDAGTMAPS